MVHFKGNTKSQRHPHRELAIGQGFGAGVPQIVPLVVVQLGRVGGDVALRKMVFGCVAVELRLGVVREPGDAKSGVCVHPHA